VVKRQQNSPTRLGVGQTPRQSAEGTATTLAPQYVAQEASCDLDSIPSSSSTQAWAGTSWQGSPWPARQAASETA
jgi:hypothetical protein